MRKCNILISIIGFLLLFSLFFAPNTEHIVLSANQLTAKANDENVEDKLKDETSSQIRDINLTELEQVLQESNTDIVPVFKSLSFRDVVQGIVDGNIVLNFSTFSNSVLNSLRVAFKGILPLLSLILAIILLASLFQKMRPEGNGSQIESIIYFATFSIVVVITATLATQVVVKTTSQLILMGKQMQAVFPVLLTLMTAVGGVTSVKTFTPAAAILTGGMSSIFLGVLLPLFSVSLVLTIVSNLSDNVKVDKFLDLVNSIFKWVIGLSFGIFMAYLAISGMTAGAVDGMSIRTAKFAIKNYVPILGGYITEGFEVVKAGSLLLKNGIGLAALFLMLGTVIVPLVSIIVLSLGFKLVAAVTQPVADKKFTSFLSGVSKSLTQLSAIIIGAGLMYFLTITMMIATANNIF